MLKDRFDEVFYTAGNHDLWVPMTPVGDQAQSSLQRLEQVKQLCNWMGVRTMPALIRSPFEQQDVSDVALEIVLEPLCIPITWFWRMAFDKISFHS